MARTRNDHAIGILYILMAAFFFCLMTFFVKLSGDLPTMEKAFFRNAVAAVIAVTTMARQRIPLAVPKKSRWPLFLRCAFGTAGLVANFWAIDRLVLADSNILNKMSPFFAIVMSYFILRERANKVEWMSVFVAFVGAAFVVQPTAGLASLPAIVGLFSGFAAGTAYTYVRKVAGQGVPGPLIVFCFSAFSCLVCIPFLAADFAPMSGRQLLFLLLAGIAAAGGQFSITAAYTHAPAKEISVFDYSQVVFAALLGFVFFREVPNVWSVLGYVIIIGVAVFRWHYNLKQDPQSPPAKDST